MGGEPPDWYALPVCYGDALAGIWLGFREMLQRGAIDRMPKLLAAEVHGSLERAFGFAEQAGVDPQSGAVCGMLAPDGSLRDGTQRIWAQAEYLRALTLRPDSQPRLLRQLLALQQRFLHAGGWYECRDGAGKVSREDMPSTTPYHLATCYSGLAQYFS